MSVRPEDVERQIRVWKTENCCPLKDLELRIGDFYSYRDVGMALPPGGKAFIRVITEEMVGLGWVENEGNGIFTYPCVLMIDERKEGGQR
jgi:hypothetical protein